MQIGVITVDGRQVGVVSLNYGDGADTFMPHSDGAMPKRRLAGGGASGDADTTPHHHYVGHGHTSHLSDHSHVTFAHRGHDDAVGNGPQDGSGPPSSILSEARQVALRGGAGAVQRFMAANGYPRDGNWCGEFAASVVHAAGGTPPRGAPVASNWRRWGTPVDRPEPGDIAIRRGVPTGSTGSHVTIVESTDGGHFIGLGGNQGAWERRFPTGQYEFRRGSASEIDRARHRAVGSGGEVTFDPETMAP